MEMTLYTRGKATDVSVYSFETLEGALKKRKKAVIEGLPCLSDKEKRAVERKPRRYSRAAVAGPWMNDDSLLYERKKLSQKKYGLVQTISVSSNRLEYSVQTVVAELCAIAAFAGGEIVKSNVTVGKEPFVHGCVTMEFSNGVLARCVYTNANTEESCDWHIYCERAETLVLPLKRKLEILKADIFIKPMKCRVPTADKAAALKRQSIRFIKRKKDGDTPLPTLFEYVKILRIAEKFQ